MLNRIFRSPKHRTETQADSTAPRSAARRVLRDGLVATAVVAVAGATVGFALAGDDEAAADAAQASAPALSTVTSDEELEERLTDRADSASRSDRRDAKDPAKAAALAPRDAQAVTRSEDVASKDPKTIARSMMGEFGFGAGEFSCLEQLWEKESGWSVTADNPTSSAYGIPQALPGSKMASAGSDWASNPVTQIRWGLGYIKDTYGSPCAAWSKSQSSNWY